MWLEWKGRKAMAMYNQHRLLGPHWQEEGEVGDLEQASTQPLNSESDDQVGVQLLLRTSSMPEIPFVGDQRHVSLHLPVDMKPYGGLSSQRAMPSRTSSINKTARQKTTRYCSLTLC